MLGCAIEVGSVQFFIGKFIQPDLQLSPLLGSLPPSSLSIRIPDCLTHCVALQLMGTRRPHQTVSPTALPCS